MVQSNQNSVFKQAENHTPIYSLTPNGGKFTVKLNLPFETRYIGYIQGDTYYKNANLSRHQFHKFPSIAFCQDLLDNEKFTWIKVICDDGRILETSRKFVLIHGIRKAFKGYEKQIFLGLNLFSRAEAEKFEKIEAQKNHQHEAELQQLSLFI